MKTFGKLQIGDYIFCVPKDSIFVKRIKVLGVSHHFCYIAISYVDNGHVKTEEFLNDTSIKTIASCTLYASEESLPDELRISTPKTPKCFEDLRHGDNFYVINKEDWTLSKVKVVDVTKSSKTRIILFVDNGVCETEFFNDCDAVKVTQKYVYCVSKDTTFKQLNWFIDCFQRKIDKLRNIQEQISIYQ